MSETAEAKSERIDLRMTPSAKRMLQKAASVANKSVSEFMLDVSLNAAVDTLADRRVFVLDEAQWDAFMQALEHPPAHNRGLDDLLSRTPPWRK